MTSLGKTRGVDDEVTWRAVQRFQTMTRGLSELATAVAGRELKVIASRDSQTYDSTIEIQPPYKLGFDIPHELSSCNRYARDGAPLCEACAINEDVLSRIYHELGHHLGGSFKLNGTRKTAGEVAIESNPYLKSILNVVEDVRCNYSVAQIRPGLTRIMRRDLNQVLASATLSILPVDIQLILVANADAENLTYVPEQLDSSVLLAKADSAWGTMLSTWTHTDSVWGSLTKAREFLHFGQRYDFFLTEEDYNLKHPRPESDEPTEEKSDEEPQSSEPEQDQEADSSGDQEAGSQESESEREPSEESGEGSQAGNSKDVSSDSSDNQPDEQPQGEGESEAPESDHEGNAQSENEPQENGDSENDGGQSSEDADMEGHEDLDSDTGEEPGTSAEGDDSQDSGDDASGEEPGGSGQDEASGNESNEGDASSDDGSGDSQPGEGQLAASSTGSPSADTPRSEHGHGTGTPGGTAGDLGPEDTTSDPADVTPDGAPEEPSSTATPNYQDWVESHGSADDVASKINEALGHDEHDQVENGNDQSLAQTKAIQKAVDQHEFFDAPSKTMGGVKVRKYEGTWTGDYRSEELLRAQLTENAPGLGLVSSNIQKLKYVFAENDRTAKEEHRKSGKVNARTLGKRAPLNDDRLFYKKTQPKKRDYTVVIGVDITGSTRGTVLRDEKSAVVAMATLLDKLHIPFSIYAHTGQGYYTESDEVNYNLHIKVVKAVKQLWDKFQQDALGSLTPQGGNFDGHALQYMRKRAEESRSTDKLVLYFSDGAMFSNDSAEQKAVFQQELAICKRKNIAVVVVEVQNDEAESLGVQTVRYDSPTDIPRVIQYIAKHLEGR